MAISCETPRMARKTSPRLRTKPTINRYVATLITPRVGRGKGLELRGDVGRGTDRTPRHRLLVESGAAGHHGTGVDSDPDVEADSTLRFRPAVEWPTASTIPSPLSTVRWASSSCVDGKPKRTIMPSFG